MEIYFKNLTPEEGTPEKLLQDLRVLKDDTEALFRATGDNLAEKSREKFLKALEKLRATCQDLHAKSEAEANATDGTDHEYPFSAVGIAFGLGILMGVLMLGHKSKPGTKT